MDQVAKFAASRGAPPFDCFVLDPGPRATAADRGMFEKFDASKLTTRASLPTMGPEAGVSLRNATIVLLSSFGVYPLVYAVPVFVDVTPAWFTAMQVGYSVADVVAKVGFGVLTHKVAKLRTAEDVAAGIETHPESVWSSHVHKSDAVLPELRRAGRR